MHLQTENILASRRLVLVGGSCSIIVGATRCSSIVTPDCGSASSEYQRLSCRRERSQTIGVTVGMVVGASLGYVVGRQIGADPRVAALIGAAAGGAIGSLAAAYGEYLLEQSDGRALGAVKLAHENLNDDIKLQQELDRQAKARLQRLQEEVERPKSVIDASARVQTELTGARDAYNKTKVYKSAPAVYRESTKLVVAKGTKAQAEVPAINREVIEISARSGELADQVQITEVQIQETVRYLTRVGIAF